MQPCLASGLASRTHGYPDFGRALGPPPLTRPLFPVAPIGRRPAVATRLPAEGSSSQHIVTKLPLVTLAPIGDITRVPARGPHLGGGDGATAAWAAGGRAVSTRAPPAHRRYGRRCSATPP